MRQHSGAVSSNYAICSNDQYDCEKRKDYGEVSSKNQSFQLNFRRCPGISEFGVLIRSLDTKQIQTGVPLRLTVKNLEDIKIGPYGRYQQPHKDEARYWPQRRREGTQPKQQPPTRKIVIQRNRTETRE